MQAVIINGPQDLVIKRYDNPEMGARDVIVRVEAGGISAADLAYFNDGAYGAARIIEPMVAGHEIAGMIEKVGANVRGLEPGDRVSVNPFIPCGTCKYCRAGNAVHCLDATFLGSAERTPHVAGGFRQLLVINHAQCYPVQSSLSAGEAAMAAPLARVLHAVNRAGSLVGARVFVTGGGPIGALCVLAARRAGAVEVVATAVSDLSLKTLEDAGADSAINVSDHRLGLRGYGDEGGHFDVLFETTGDKEMLGKCVKVMRANSVLVQVAMCNDVMLPGEALIEREFDCRGAFRFNREFGVAVDMMNKGLIDVSPLISDTFEFEDAEEAFRIAHDDAKSVKVQLSL